MNAGEARSGRGSDRASARSGAAMPLVVTRHDPRGRQAQWRANVGATLAEDAEPIPHERGAPLLALSWNVWIGRGRLLELVAGIREGAFAALGAPAGAPLLVMLQEAYRVDDAIPAGARGAAGAFSARFRPEEEIRDVARRLGLSLRYAPSMRNGRDRSDRGNAILASVRLEDARARELPFALQRRVAVSATAVLGDGRRVRAHSAHFDPRGGTARDLLGLAARAAQAAALVTALDEGGRELPAILGADLNLGGGRREPAYRLLTEAGFASGVPQRPPGWDHTYHRAPRLNLDYILFRDGGSRLRSAEVRRIDEHPRDAGPYVFHSDHHPLLARVELHDDGGVP